MQTPILLGKVQCAGTGPGAAWLLGALWQLLGAGTVGQKWVWEGRGKHSSPRLQPLPSCWGMLLQVRLLGLDGISVDRMCHKVHWDTWGKQGSSGEESGSELQDPLHSAQHHMVLFISFLLGMWNREHLEVTRQPLK